MKAGATDHSQEASEPRAGEESAAVAELPELLSEIDELMRAGDDDASPQRERRLVRARHLAGIQLLAQAPTDPAYATPAYDSLPDDTNLVEIPAQELTPQLLRAAILERGCLLVRGLVDKDEALSIADGIDRAFAERAAVAAGEDNGAYYRVFGPEPAYQGTLSERPWIEMGGGLLAVDSSKLMFAMFDALERAGFLDVVHGYLGERATISAQKTTLRKADPEVAGAWHQDGKFLGEVRALNLWLSLSRCGDEAPGLDIVPRRVEDLLESGGEGIFPIQISQENAEQAAGEGGILRPIFEPGDALLFDELFLHKTGSDPSMPKARYAIESWFFGPSVFPEEYAPLAV